MLQIYIGSIVILSIIYNLPFLIVSYVITQTSFITNITFLLGNGPDILIQLELVVKSLLSVAVQSLYRLSFSFDFFIQEIFQKALRATLSLVRRKKIYYRDLMLLIVLCNVLIIMNRCRGQSILKTSQWFREFVITINAQVLQSLEWSSCPKGQSILRHMVISSV